MIKPKFLMLAAFCAGSVACTGTNHASASPPRVQSPPTKNVRTTAYTHTESDHVTYGAKSAEGGTLKYGGVRSAAADWSVYPVGTKFQIEGDPCIYEVDDYGSALVGTETIDIYKPSKAAMDEWGVRNVKIKVIQWGSFLKSLAIMKPRATKAPHIRQMIQKIESNPPSVG